MHVPTLFSLATTALSTFPRTTLAVYFVLSYQTIADELYASHDKAVDAAAVEAAYLAVCTRIAEQLRDAGYRTVTTAIADKKYLRLDPLVSPHDSAPFLAALVFCLLNASPPLSHDRRC